MLIKGYGDTILQPEGFGNMYQTLNVQTLWSNNFVSFFFSNNFTSKKLSKGINKDYVKRCLVVIVKIIMNNS